MEKSNEDGDLPGEADKVTNNSKVEEKSSEADKSLPGKDGQFHKDNGALDLSKLGS